MARIRSYPLYQGQQKTVVGNPARFQSYVCEAGHPLNAQRNGSWHCPVCGREMTLPVDKG